MGAVEFQVLHLVRLSEKAESFLRTLELFKVSTLTLRHSAAEVTQCQMAASRRKHPVLLTLLRLFSLVARGHMGSRARRHPTLELLNHLQMSNPTATLRHPAAEAPFEPEAAIRRRAPKSMEFRRLRTIQILIYFSVRRFLRL